LVMGSFVSSEEEVEEVEEVQQSRQQYKALKPGLDSTIQTNPATKLSDKSAKSRPSSETRGSAENTSPVHRRSYSREASTNRDVLVRQQGDGMEEEVLILNKPQEEVSDKPPSEVHKILAETAPGVRLPETGITLARLPPINDKVELLPTVPKSPLVMEKPKVYPKGTYPPSVMKAREAKFVPYEPYKGAVTQFTNGKHVRKTPEKKTSLQTEHLDAGAVPESPEETGLSRELVHNYRIMLDAKENEMSRLQTALQNSEKQLKIQTQVNSEIKNLLVASVGEDIEARVDFLTQDKARLSADLITYNNKISRDWEEKDQLTVESDIWRSKFLACSLILEEVSRTKIEAETRANQLEHAARLVLNERSEVLRTLASAQGVLDNLAVSFNPLHSPTQDQPRDLVDLSSHVKQSARALKDRLVGDKATEEKKIETPPVDTAAEAELRMILGSAHSTDSAIPEQASSSLSKGARSLLLKMGDKAQAPGKSGFGNCSHCNGTVHIV